MACKTYTYTSGAKQLYLLPSGQPPRKDNRKRCTMGDPCLDGTPCTGGYCPNEVPANFQMLTNKNREPTQDSPLPCGNTSQDVILGDGTQVKYPTQCFAPILNSLNRPSCGLYKGSVPLPIPCNDALAEKLGNGDYYPLYPTDGDYPQQPDFVNCQNDVTGGSCRPFTFQTKIDPAYAEQYRGKLNVFGYWGATNMWSLPELTLIHPTYNQVIISFFHIDKYNGKLAIKCTMQGYGHESIWDEAPPWSVFPDGYSPAKDCKKADSDCTGRDEDCCRWVHNGEGDPVFGKSIAKLIKDIQTWKSAARPDRPRTVLASFGGGSGANVTDPNGVGLGTGAFTEKDIVKKDNFVQTVLDFLITWGFDGIDNDYEALGGQTCPIGAPGSDIRKNWEDLYSGLRACNPGIILTAAPFNNEHLWQFVNSGLFDEIRPQLYNGGGYQREKKKTPGAPDGAADTWVGLLKNIGGSSKTNGRGGYINVPGVLLEASCRSGSGSLKEQCWDMGRLANTIIYLNQQGEFGKEGKMMSVGVWDIAQGQRLTDDSFAAAMNVITIHMGHASTPEPANLKCYYNKIFVDPCTGTNKCWADCGAESGSEADGGKKLVDNHCDYWISPDGYCGDGPAYQNGVQCGTRCEDCRTGDDADGGQAGKPCGAWCSRWGYCGTGRDYSEDGTQCGKAPGPCDGKTRINYCHDHGNPTPSQGACGCECDAGWTGDRCNKKSDGVDACTAQECATCPWFDPLVCLEGRDTGGCFDADHANVATKGGDCTKWCDTSGCPKPCQVGCAPGSFCPGQVGCPDSGCCDELLARRISI